MPPRPLYRWKSFWLGILGIVVLGSAWARSIHFGEIVLFGGPTAPSGTMVGQSRGVVGITTFRPPAEFSLMCSSPVAGNRLSRISAWRNPHGHPRYEIPSAAEFHRFESHWSFGLAHWLLTLLFTGAWVAGLRRRWKLMKRWSQEHRAA